MPEDVKKGFYARFLGGFFLEYEGKRVVITKNMKQKSMQILAILLKAGQEGVTRKNLIEMLEWGGDSWERKLNNLRRHTYKLRSLIAEAGFPEGQYIQVAKGRYYFRLDCQVQTDTGEIDWLYREAKGQTDPEARESILWEICQLYRGEFLPSLVAEEWALVENAHYRSVYSRCVNELCRILKGRGDYPELLRLCSTASQIHPYDEWQAVQIDCLMASRRYQDARQIRRQANQLFSKELGIAPFADGEGKQECQEKPNAVDEEVMGEIVTGLLEENVPKGAYRCDYPQFIDVYRFMVRVSERGQASLNLLLCTLQPARGKPEGAGVASHQVSQRQMEGFGELLAGLIRENDVYTRCSLNQYLVLLANFGESKEPEVAERLRRGWKAFEEEEGLLVELEVKAVEVPNRKEAM